MVCFFTSEHAWKGNFLIGFVHVRLIVFQIFSSLKVFTFHELCLVAAVVVSSVTFVVTSWFYFAGCNKPKIEQGVITTCVSYWPVGFALFSEVCKHMTSLGLLKSCESDKCS